MCVLWRGQGVACLKSNVRNCRDVVNAFIQKDPQKGAFTNSVDPDETPQNAASRELGPLSLQTLKGGLRVDMPYNTYHN